MLKQSRSDIMGMPITVEIADSSASVDNIAKVFNYFISIDEKFSPYKTESVVSKINRGEIKPEDYDKQTKEIAELSEKTKQATQGYFNVWRKNKFDPSGLVKGWAISKAADILKTAEYKNFYIEAGGDIQTCGKNAEQKNWSVGIRNPFQKNEIIKVVLLNDGKGMATSGNYERGEHIYNPFSENPISDIVSLTVIGPNVYEADRFATAAYAMGMEGINFIESVDGLEGYIIDTKGIATMTSGFNRFVITSE